MREFAAVMAVLVGVAGWHYLFYSKAAAELGEIEHPSLNRKRIRLRRFGGFLMLVLAVAFLVLFWTVTEPVAVMAVLMTIMVLLATILVLAMVDMRLTWQLRRKPNEKKHDDTA